MGKEGLVREEGTKYPFLLVYHCNQSCREGKTEQQGFWAEPTSNYILFSFFCTPLPVCI